MRTLLLVLAITIGVLIALALVAYLGLNLRPAPFARYPEPTPALPTIPLPAGLPAPVERFYRTACGDRIPVIESAVLTGRAVLRVPVPFPSRWRFTHQAGQGYRHYIEATIFRRPLMKVNESYLDGKARMELPGGVVENDPKTDMAANLSLWGEYLFMPSVLLTGPRVRWEPIDDTHARLVVPYGAEEDSFTVTFDPETGLVRSMEAMRWKAATSASKTRWILEPLGWERFHGTLLPARFSMTWEGDKAPWFVGTVEEVVYNVDVRTYIRASGP